MKPALYLVNAFDAFNDYTFKFKWEGNQSFGSTCIIRNNETNETVYQGTETTMQLQYTLPGETLSNGTLYNVSIASIDKDNVVSEFSNPVLFYCYSTPTFEFENIIDNQIVRNSTFQITLTYLQEENESLQSYEISLYDLSKVPIQSSGIRYSTDTLTYSLSNLEDNQSYYIRATGKTLNGMDIETDYIYFSVNYEQPAVYSVLSLENVSSNGYIKLQSNIRAVEFHTGSDPIFIDDEYIDVRNDILYLDSDFSFDTDFIVNICGYNLGYGLLMQLSNETTTINLYLRKGTYEINGNVEKTYIEMIIPVGFTNFQCYSNYIDNPKDEELVSFWLKKKNGLFQIILENKGMR